MSHNTRSITMLITINNVIILFSVMPLGIQMMQCAAVIVAIVVFIFHSDNSLNTCISTIVCIFPCVCSVHSFLAIDSLDAKLILLCLYTRILMSIDSVLFLSHGTAAVYVVGIYFYVLSKPSKMFRAPNKLLCNKKQVI